MLYLRTRLARPPRSDAAATTDHGPTLRGFARTHDRRSQRWSDAGVTEAEVISYPDHGLLIQLCFAGLDRMFTQNLQQKLFTETAQVRLLAENDGSFRAQFDRF